MGYAQRTGLYTASVRVGSQAMYMRDCAQYISHGKVTVCGRQNFNGRAFRFTSHCQTTCAKDKFNPFSSPRNVRSHSVSVSSSVTIRRANGLQTLFIIVCTSKHTANPSTALYSGNFNRKSKTNRSSVELADDLGSFPNYCTHGILDVCICIYRGAPAFC